MYRLSPALSKALVKKQHGDVEKNKIVSDNPDAWSRITNLEINLCCVVQAMHRLQAFVVKMDETVKLNNSKIESLNEDVTVLKKKIEEQEKQLANRQQEVRFAQVGDTRSNKSVTFEESEAKSNNNRRCNRIPTGHASSVEVGVRFGDRDSVYTIDNCLLDEAKSVRSRVSTGFANRMPIGVSFSNDETCGDADQLDDESEAEPDEGGVAASRSGTSALKKKPSTDQEANKSTKLKKTTAFSDADLASQASHRRKPMATSDLPRRSTVSSVSSADVDDEHEIDKKVGFATRMGVGDGQSSRIRKGTGYTNSRHSDSDSSSSQEGADRGRPVALEGKKVNFETGTELSDKNTKKKTRVPTSYVSAPEMPDESSDERGEKVVKISTEDEKGHEAKRKIRTPTCFEFNQTRTSSGEEEGKKEVSFQVNDGKSHDAKKKTRQATTFAKEEDLPSDEDDEGKKEVSFQVNDGKSHDAKKKTRQATTFAKEEDLPSDEDDEGKKEVSFQVNDGKSHDAKKKTRQATAFAKEEDLPSDEGDEGKKEVCFATNDGETHEMKNKTRQATAFARKQDLPSDAEDEGGQAVTFKISDGKAHEAKKKIRQATAFVKSEERRSIVDEGGSLKSDGSKSSSNLSKPPKQRNKIFTGLMVTSDVDMEVVECNTLDEEANKKIQDVDLDLKVSDGMPEEPNKKSNFHTLVSTVTLSQQVAGTMSSIEKPRSNSKILKTIDAPKNLDLIKQSLRSLEFFADLDGETCALMAKEMNVYPITKGHDLTSQGNRLATMFYIVEEGLFEVIRDGEKINEISRGKLLGESVILLSGAQNATVTCVTQGLVYGMSGKTARRIMRQEYMNGKQKHVINALHDILSQSGYRDDCLRDLTTYQETLVYQYAEVKIFAKGETIVQQGTESPGGCYVMVEGEVQSYLDGCLTGPTIQPFSMIGDQSIAFNANDASYKASQRTVALYLSEELLSRMYGQELQNLFLKHLIERNLINLEGFHIFSGEELEEIISMADVIKIEPDESFERHAASIAFCIAGNHVQVSMTDAVGTTTVRETLDGLDSTALGTQSLTRGSIVPQTLHAHNSGPRTAHMVVWGDTLEPIADLMCRHISAIKGGKPQTPAEVKSRWKRVQTVRRHAVMHGDMKKALKNFFIFSSLSKDQLNRLASMLTVRKLQEGELLFSQGMVDHDLFIIHKGLLEVRIDGNVVRSMSVGDYVGERALLFNEPRSATVQAIEPCELWKLNKSDFQEIIPASILNYMQHRVTMQNTQVPFDALICEKHIGTGGFGCVKIVTTDKSVRYALKSVNIKRTVLTRQTHALARERSILAEIDHPFLINFIRTYRTQQYVYFLMELVTGGELLQVASVLGNFNLEQARFYFGSIVLALEYMHERRIAYLDLKGENCLIDTHGYLKLIDFGTAERVTHGRIFDQHRGTPFYTAPEVFLPNGFTTVADLWSLGVCVYTYMSEDGWYPFGIEDEDADLNAWTTVAGKIFNTELTFCPGLEDPQAQSFVVGLLQKDPKARLGAGFHGYTEVKCHPFFTDFSWENLLARRMTPPYLPHNETYAEDQSPTPNRRQTLCVNDDKPDEKEAKFDMVVVKGLTDTYAKINGRYKFVGEFNECPYFQSSKNSNFIWRGIFDGEQAWCLGPELPESKADEDLIICKVWILNNDCEGSYPPEEGWSINGTEANSEIGQPRVDAYILDPEWLKQFGHWDSEQRIAT